MAPSSPAVQRMSLSAIFWFQATPTGIVEMKMKSKRSITVPGARHISRQQILTGCLQVVSIRNDSNIRESDTTMKRGRHYDEISRRSISHGPGRPVAVQSITGVPIWRRRDHNLCRHCFNHKISNIFLQKKIYNLNQQTFHVHQKNGHERVCGNHLIMKHVLITSASFLNNRLSISIILISKKSITKLNQSINNIDYLEKIDPLTKSIICKYRLLANRSTWLRIDYDLRHLAPKYEAVNRITTIALKWPFGKVEYEASPTLYVTVPCKSWRRILSTNIDWRDVDLQPQSPDI